MSEISEKILTEEQKKACDEIAELIDGYKAEKPVTVNLHDASATINLQMVMAKDVLFGEQKKFYKVFFEKKTEKGKMQIIITDLVAMATKNNYNRNVEALIITGSYGADLVKQLGEQLYSAMYFSGHKDYVKREMQIATLDKSRNTIER